MTAPGPSERRPLSPLAQLHAARRRPVAPPPTIEPARELLVEAGFQPGDVLGEGHCGVVFKDLATGGVVKVTDRLHEAAVARWLMNDVPDAHPGMARYTSATRLSKQWRHQTAYVVQREELPDVPQLSRRFYRATEHLENALRKELLPQAHTTAIAVTAEKVRSGLEERDTAPFQQLLEILWWARDHGMSLMGLHEHNFGLRGEQLVLRDYTACWPPKAWVATNLVKLGRSQR